MKIFIFGSFLIASGAFYTELNTTIVLSAIESRERLSQVNVTSPSPAIELAKNKNISANRTNAVHKTAISANGLLSASHIAYICNGELVAFIVAWNLIMEFIVMVALISKALIMYIDAIAYGDVGHLTQLVSMNWPLAQYFDVLALLVPCLLGGKLLTFALYFLNKRKSVRLHFLFFSFVFNWMGI